MKRYVVFYRTQGSKSWCVAMKNAIGKPKMRLPAEFHKRENALKFIKTEIETKKGWWGGVPNQRPYEGCIITVTLPK